MRTITCVLLSLLVAPTLSAQRSEKKCRDTPVDSTNPAAPIYRDCHTDRAAKPLGTSTRLSWDPSPSEVRLGACYSANFEFVVDTTGVPEAESIRAGKSTNAGFARATLERIPSLRYAPAQRDGQPVRQLIEYRERATIGRAVSTSPTSRPPKMSVPNC
ncbi:MAG: hypothetical protein IT353_08975 [Gemmatimonadaceae bacterium]|nr:hypothetical protein [Gemmatimonadaceae bacterium]